MNIILSRKGFDSSYGGYPSLVMPNGQMISLPIPNDEDNKKYSEINSGYQDMSLYEIMKQLKDRVLLGNNTRKLAKEALCHLDPDLRAGSHVRENNWKGCFGQIDAASQVLFNNGIDKEDLFLFFGWFQHCKETNGKLSLAKGEGFHALFGYLQIEDIFHTQQLERESLPVWLQDHPHVMSNDRYQNKLNTIYIARDHASWNSRIQGYGTFSYTSELKLTKEGLSRSKWNLPDIFRGQEITYHSESSWKPEGYFQSAARGQEFVIKESEDISQWAQKIVNTHANRE